MYLLAMGGGNADISGIIVKGLGEGAVFMSMPHYKQEIKKNQRRNNNAGHKQARRYYGVYRSRTS